MKKLKMLIATTLAVVMLVPMGACVSGGGEKIDKSKTQLYVGNYDGGYGTKWMTELERRFEEKYADFSFEEGKKGVQVLVDNNKSYTADEMLDRLATSDREVVFVSGQKFYKMTDSKLLMDISDIVQEDLSSKYEGETGNIESKIPETVMPYCKAADGKYYALPSFDGSLGVIYDKDLFNEKKLYFAKNGAPSEAFQENGSFSNYIFTNYRENNLSAGPDGEYGTMDDGLPATYDEFFYLCDMMEQKNITPFSWTGTYIENYSLFLYKYAFVDYEGKASAELQFNAGSVVGKNTTTLVKFDADGNPMFDAQRNPVLEDGETTITVSNYDELARQPGRYYALKFWEKIIKEKYYTKASVNNSQSHVMAQTDYIESKYTSNPIAFLLEGPWWENEVRVSGGVEAVVENQGKEADPANRNFGFFPMPKATQAQVGQKTTVQTGNSSAFINAKTKANKKLVAKMFLQFAYTDESLNFQTEYTGLRSGVNYEITEDTYKNLSPFARDMLKFNENANQAYEVFPTKEISYAVEDKYEVLERTQSRVGGISKQSFFYSILTDKISSTDYFKGFYERIKTVK